MLFLKGKPGRIAAALSGSRLRLVIGAHYYDLAEAFALWEDGWDFKLSTQLLHGPGAIELVVERYGANRLVFGSGAPLSAAGSAVRVLETSGLGEGDLRRVRRENLEALLGGGPAK